MVAVIMQDKLNRCEDCIQDKDYCPDYHNGSLYKSIDNEEIKLKRNIDNGK
jgi:hypothetical protein